jgi:hypothetical protein
MQISGGVGGSADAVTLAGVTPGAAGLDALQAATVAELRDDKVDAQQADAGLTSLAAADVGAGLVYPSAANTWARLALTDATGVSRLMPGTLAGVPTVRRATSMLRRTWSPMNATPGLEGAATFNSTATSVGAAAVDGRWCGRLTRSSVGNVSWHQSTVYQACSLGLDREFSVDLHLSSVTGINLRAGPQASGSIVAGSGNSTVSCLQLRGHTGTTNWQFETRDGATSNVDDTGVAFAIGYYHLVLWRLGGTVGWAMRYSAGGWPTDATAPTVGSTTDNPPTGNGGIQIGGDLTDASAHTISAYGLVDIEYIP